MNARGQYGGAGQGRARVGAFFVHAPELKQRYNNAHVAAVQALLNDLAREGVASSVGANRWEIALKEGAWVQLTWYPDSSALEVTITDREQRPVDQVVPARRRYEALLRRITPRLQNFGAMTVGAAIVGQTPAPRLVARRRAIRAVFDMYAHARVPYYIYAEVNGLVDQRLASSLDEANAIFFALENAPGEVYVAIFDPTDPLWPGPSLDVYHEAAQDQTAIAGRLDPHGRGHYGSQRTAVGLKIYHSVGDRLDAVNQMALDWTALYRDLAVQAGELTPDPKAESGYHITTQVEFDALNPDPKKVAWWKSIAKPRIHEWTKFKSDQLGTDLTWGGDYVGWTERFKTDWDVYEGWMAKLAALTAVARLQGFSIGVPPATPLPTTVWADVENIVKKGAEKLGGGAEDVWKLFKYGAWAVLGIGAVVALSSAAQNLRSGKDPGEKYMELIRTRHRPRAPRALPPGGGV